MVVEQNNFIVRNFEKIISVFVAIIFIFSLAYMLLKNRAEDVEDMVSQIERNVDVIESGGDDPPPIDIPSYVRRWEESLVVRRPDEIKDIFWPHFPVHYPPREIGTEREYVLQFTVPIDENTVAVSVMEGDASLEDEVKIEHPYLGDYSRVGITPGAEEGVLQVSARGGGRAHIRLAVIDPTIDVPPEPPLDIRIFAERREVELRFKPNQDNKEGVVVEGYEIYKKKARDFFADFQFVDSLEVCRDELSSEALALLKEEDIRPSVKMVPERNEESVETDELSEYMWVDEEVDPGEIYFYKIRTVGLRSSPRKSEFTEMSRAKTKPVVDFRYTEPRDDKFVFEVCFFIGGEFEFENGIEDRDRSVRREREFEDDERRAPEEKREVIYVLGDRIGKTADLENEDRIDFNTECILLDVHGDAMRKRPYSTGRIAYVDKKGEIQSRWRTYWGTGRDDDYPWEPEVDEEEREDRYPQDEYDDPLEEYLRGR